MIVNFAYGYQSWKETIIGEAQFNTNQCEEENLGKHHSIYKISRTLKAKITY